VIGLVSAAPLGRSDCEVVFPRHKGSGLLLLIKRTFSDIGGSYLGFDDPRVAPLIKCFFKGARLFSCSIYRVGAQAAYLDTDGLTRKFALKDLILAACGSS